MQIGNDSTGYQASGYFDIGTYRSAGGSETSTRGHNQIRNGILLNIILVILIIYTVVK